MYQNGFSAEGTHFERVGITSLPQLHEEANVSRAQKTCGLSADVKIVENNEVLTYLVNTW